MEKPKEKQTPEQAMLILNENLHDLDRRVLFLEDLIFSLVKKAEQENAVDLFDGDEEQTQEDKGMLSTDSGGQIVKPKEQECENIES